jgi:hypothetical protein
MPNSVLNRLTVDVSRSHKTYTISRTPLNSRRDRSLATQQTGIYAVSEIRTRDLSHQVVAQPPRSVKSGIESSNSRTSRWAGHAALIAKRISYRIVEGKYETMMNWNTSVKC